MIALLFVGTLFTTAKEATALGALDQQQTNLNPSADYSLCGSNTGLAQTFTAGQSGKLDTVALQLFAIPPVGGDLPVEIRSTSGGVPTSTVLAAATIGFGQVSHQLPPFTKLQVTFNSAASVTAGSVYAIVLRNPTGDSNCPGGGYWGVGVGFTKTDYPIGRIFNSSDGKSFFFCDCNPSIWFQTYVTAGSIPSPTCGTQDSIVTGGPSAYPGLQAQAAVASDLGVAFFLGIREVPISEYTATVDWGDGSTSPGEVRNLSPVDACGIVGTHAYALAGHYAVKVTLHGGYSLVSFAGSVVAVSPTVTAPVSAIGVLTSDNGPQCTATVVDMGRSYDQVKPSLSKFIRARQRWFNNDVIVTAAHCVLGQSGFMFAPGFSGIAPRYSRDYSPPQQVSSSNDPANDPYGSPFQDKQIGNAPKGVWGCSHDSRSTRQCGFLGLGDANVYVPERELTKSADNSYDYAFLTFKTAPQGESRSLLEAAGGLPVSFDAPLTPGLQLQHIAYDVNWLDSNDETSSAGWFDLINPPEMTGVHGNCESGGAGLQAESCHYYYPTAEGGPRKCSLTVDVSKNLTQIGLTEKRSSILASLCNLGVFSSGAPFMAGSDNAIVGVTKAGIHAGIDLDPVVPRLASGRTMCCTQVITPLRDDAAQWGLIAEVG